MIQNRWYWYLKNTSVPFSVQKHNEQLPGLYPPATACKKYTGKRNTSPVMILQLACLIKKQLCSIGSHW